MMRAAVSGAGGRMGKRIICAIEETDGITLSGALEAPSYTNLGQDAGDAAGIGSKGVPITDDMDRVYGDADVLIDFTNHEASMGHLRKAAELGKAIVIGSTGFTPGEWEEIRRIGPGTRCVVSPNMSVGVNLMLRVIRDVAEALGPAYDMEIVEAHHRRKADAPSGTAVRMAEVLAAARGENLEDVGVFARHGQVGPRTDREIGVQTIRAGDIVGEHTVIYAGVGERIEITHRAHSRDNFARGAIRAAMWLLDRPHGLYDMQDVLGLK